MKIKFFRKIKWPLIKTWHVTSLLLCPLALTAQNGVTVSNFSTKAGSPTALTFDIRWARQSGKVWSDTVWVFADYNNKGKMARLPLAPGAKLTNPSWRGAKVMEVSGNPNGVWVVGNARTSGSGSFSATVQLLTATATATGACVYAVNYPPVGRYTAVDKIKFNGTPPFKLKFGDGSSYSLSRQDAQSTYTVAAGKTLLSFTDASKAPGVTGCKAPDVQTLNASASSYCEGSGVTLSLNGTERGVIYQLYNGSSPIGGATVTGSGPAATFTKPGGSTSFGAGAYTVRVAKTNVFCAATMTGTRTVTVKPLPAVPTNPSANKYCGSGAVTFSAVAPGGCTIDWYNAVSGGSIVGGGSGVTSFSPALTETTTYYAQARNTTTGCVSTARLAVTGTVNALPAAPSGASANELCGAGAVIFSATAPGGCTVDWYTAAWGGSIVSGGSGVTSLSPALTVTTTYYAQARNTTTGCVSVTRLAVTGTVNAVP